MPVAIVECPTAVLVGRTVDARLAEPRSASAQRRERRHHIGVPVEVVPPHAIEHEDARRRAVEQNRAARPARHGPSPSAASTPRVPPQALGRRPAARPASSTLLFSRLAPRTSAESRRHTPRGTVHVRDVRLRPRDEVAFPRHDQELAGSAGKIRPREHLEDALSRRREAASPTPWSASRCLVPGRSLTCWLERPSHRVQDQVMRRGTASGHLRGDGTGSRRRHGARFTSNWTTEPGPAVRIGPTVRRHWSLRTGGSQLSLILPPTGAKGEHHAAGRGPFL